jgi:transcriptional regulator with XRE-family HTH domain
MATSYEHESFRGLLLRHRGRTGLIQRDLAAQAGVSLRSVQDWEAGVTLPTAARLQALTVAFIDAGAFTPGRETSEAREFWRAAERVRPRMHTPFDEEWFARLLTARDSATSAPATDRLDTIRATEPDIGGAGRAQDWEKRLTRLPGRT